MAGGRVEVRDLSRVFRIVMVMVFLAPSVCARAEYARPDLQGPVTLDEALELAFRYSPQIKLALDRVERGKGGVREARANFMPKFSAKLDHIRQGPAISFADPSTGESAVLSREHNTILDAVLLLPIDVNKRLSYIGDLSKYQFQIDYLDVVTTSEQLIFDVKKTYYDVLRAEGLQDVAQSAVDVAAARLKDSQAKFKAGTVAKFDVTRGEVEVGNLTQILISTQQGVETSRARLNATLGIDVNSPTQVVMPDIEVKQIEVDIPKRIQQAYTRRPEVKSAETGIQLSARNIRLQRTAILPSVEARGNFRYDTRTAGFSAENESWLLGIALNMSIWDGGVTKAKVDQAHADLMTSEDTLDQVKLTVSLQVRVAALNLEEATRRVSSSAENVMLAEESLRLATVRYEAGIALLVEATDAESALNEAGFNLVRDRYDYALALAQLERATATQPEINRVQILNDAYLPS